MAEKPINNSTIARIAGNIAAGLLTRSDHEGYDEKAVAENAVAIARAIAAEVERTDESR